MRYVTTHGPYLGDLEPREQRMSRIISFIFVLILTVAGCSDESMMSAPEMESDAGDLENTATFRRGSFEATPGIGKMAAGTATLNTLNDGSLRVEFSSDFSVTDGPGLFVMLSKTEFPSTDAVNLGSFINPTGAQFYAVPDSVSLDDYGYILVHCVPFDVTFAYAELK